MVLGLVRDLGFLVTLAAVFTLQIVNGPRLEHGPHQAQALQSTATLVVMCGLLGIARVWELMGGPAVSLESEARALGRETVDKARDSRRRDT